VVGISARSSGEMNVQVIMEAFGGGGQRDLLGSGDHLGQGAAALLVEGGEDVVEDEDGLTVPAVGVDIGAQHVVGGQAQCEGQGPLLAVGGESAGGQAGEEQGEVVAVRPDEVRAAVDLAGVELTHGTLQARGEGGLIEERLLAGEPGRLVVGVGFRESLVGQQARAVGELGAGTLPAGPGDGLVGGGHPGAQAPHDIDTGGDESSGRGGELGVPDLQGGEHGGGR